MKKLLVLVVLLWGVAQPVWAEQPSDGRKRAQIHTELGASYFGMGKLGVALEELKIATESDSRYAPAYNILGLIHMELREFDKAEGYFQRSLNIDSSNSEAHNNYGWFLCQRNRVDAAIEHFMQALKNPLYSTPEKAYLNAGECSLKKGDEKGAEEFFLRAIRFQPAPPKAFWNLAELSFRRGDYNDAQSYLDVFLKTGGQTREALWLGARIAHSLGKRDAEANYGLQLRKNYPDSPETQAFRNGQFDVGVASGVQK